MQIATRCPTTAEADNAPCQELAAHEIIAHVLQTSSARETDIRVHERESV
jgi:hypothetical protein